MKVIGLVRISKNSNSVEISFTKMGLGPDISSCRAIIIRRQRMTGPVIDDLLSWIGRADFSVIRNSPDCLFISGVI